MSTIKITFTTQALDFGPLTRGLVDVIYNDGTNDLSLKLRLIQGFAPTGYFQEVAWVSGQDVVLNNQQAVNFASAFNRDYKNVGGTKNLQASVIGNEVTILAKTGTFPEDAEYTGNVLVIDGTDIDNVSGPTALVTAVTATSTGNCTTIQYSATVSGGTANYSLVNGGTTIQTGWNGSAATFNLTRGTLNTLVFTDSLGQTKSVTINVPRKLSIGEFKERSTQFEDYSDIEIESVNPVAGTTPVEYSITVLGEPTGIDYQTSNSFPGVLPGEYILWVKDKFGCEISKIIEVREFEDGLTEDVIPFFLIPEANALIFSEDVEYGGTKRKNYFNTTTREELSIGRRHQIVQPFFITHEIPTRFLSSYPFHVVTLFGCDGSKTNIPIATVQTNLGSREKVDCKLFSVGGAIGVYFDGGNEYEPSTTTVIGASPHTEGTPDWALIGQLVFFDGLGAKYITGEGFDDDRGYYFTVDGTTTDDVAEKVQATYNKHPYNLFDFFVYMSDVDRSAMVTVEYGFSFDEIIGVHKSEVIEVVEDTPEWHLVKWGDSRNKGDMVYQSFPQPFILLKGKLDNVYPNESDTSRGDSKTYSLDEENFLGFSFRTTKISRKLANKLTIAAGTDYFEIQGINLRKVGSATVENFGNTNLKTWSCEFDYGGNQLGIKADEIDVLDVSSGVVGGGNSAKGDDVPELGEPLVFDGKTRYVDSLGNFFVIGEDFVTVE